MFTIKDTLLHAVTEYDRKQSKKRGYNHYALAQYMTRVDDVLADIEAGANPFEAINAGFCGPLLAHVTKTVARLHPDIAPASQPKVEGAWTYKPVKA
jgi:hypothetical protein